MPIYEYQCEDCTDRFEVKQSMKDDPLTTCPRCGKRVQRLISSPAIMFKGSGWYVTDYSDKMKPSSDSEVPAPADWGKERDGARHVRPDDAYGSLYSSSFPRVRAGKHPVEHDLKHLKHNDDRAVVFEHQIDGRDKAR